jgi:hypothetical protein
MKKTEGRKSLDTVSLRQFSKASDYTFRAHGTLEGYRYRYYPKLPKISLCILATSNAISTADEKEACNIAKIKLK